MVHVACRREPITLQGDLGSSVKPSSFGSFSCKGVNKSLTNLQKKLNNTTKTSDMGIFASKGFSLASLVALYRGHCWKAFCHSNRRSRDQDRYQGNN